MGKVDVGGQPETIYPLPCDIIHLKQTIPSVWWPVERRAKINDSVSLLFELLHHSRLLRWENAQGSSKSTQNGSQTIEHHSNMTQ